MTTDLVCPRCGSKLLGNGKVVWCTFIGGYANGVFERPCGYGFYKVVTVAEAEAVQAITGEAGE